MLERALTTRCCARMIALLRKRRWTIARIARTIGASSDYVHRVQSAKQSFQLPEVEALARGCRQPTHMFILDAVEHEKLSPAMQGLRDLALREVQRHKELQRSISGKESKKRRMPTKAA